MKNITLLISFLVFSTVALNAQWTTDTDLNTLVAASESGDMQAIGTSDGQTYIVFWKTVAAPINFELRLQVLDALGNQQFGPEGILVSSNISMSTFTAIGSVAVDSDDNLYIGATGTANEMGHAFKMDIDGNHLWGTDGVTVENGYLVKILPLSDGGGIVSWSPFSQALMQRYDAEGNAVWSEPQEVISGTSKTAPGDLFELSGGDFVMVFHTYSFGINSTLYAQRYNGDGEEQWSSPTQLSNKTTVYNTNYSTAQDGDNMYYGYVGKSMNRFDSFVQRINPDGTLPWGINGMDFDTNETDFEMDTRIAHSPGSQNIWAICTYTDTNQNEPGEYVQKFDKHTGARLFTDNAKVVYGISSEFNRHLSSLYLVNDQPFYLISKGFDNGATPTTLHALLLDSNGNFAWPEETKPIATFSASKGREQQTRPVNGQAVTVWIEDKNTGDRIYAQNLMDVLLQEGETCMPAADCSMGNGIVEFSIGSFSNTSGCESDNDTSGYADFTGLTGLELAPDSTYSVTLLSGADNQQVSIWIDANNNNSFESSELILADEPVGTTPVTTMVTIPSTMPIGAHRLRVQAANNEQSSLDACDQPALGETEDYTAYFSIPISCHPVESLTVSNISHNSAIVSWTDTNDATAWDVEIVEEGNIPAGVPTTGYNDITNPVEIMDLMSTTTYHVYVRADCGEDDSDVSSWVGPISITTTCAPFIPPYYEYFEEIFGGFPECWSEADNGTPATGPVMTGASEWGEDGFGNIGNNGALRLNLYQGDVVKDWLISPVFDLSSGNTYQVEFDFSITAYSNSSAANLGSDDEVAFLISVDGGTSWTSLQTWTAADDINPEGIRIIHDLSAYSGMEVTFAFWGSDGVIDDPEDINVYVDNFFVRTPPSCPEITDLTIGTVMASSAEVNWVENGPVISWDLEFGLAGFSPTGEPSTDYDDIENPITITGLSAATAYEVYVRADCGGDNSSDVALWVGPVYFETPCATYSVPYLEEFTSTPYECWTQANAGDPSTGPMEFDDFSGWQNGGFANVGSSGAAKINLYNVGDNDWLISPAIAISGDEFQASFDFSITEFANSNAGNLGSDDRVVFLISTDNMATWTSLMEWDSNSNVDPLGEHFVFDLSQYANMNVNFAFWATEGTVDDLEDNDIFVDNFAINTGSSSLEVTAVLTNVSCNGLSDGAIDLIPNGGVAPLTFNWSNEATTEDISGLSAGEYNVMVTDADGNMVEFSAIITEPDTIGGITLITNESINDAADGSIDLTVSGGTPDYTFLWDNGATTEDIQNLDDGTYCVTITDANGCTNILCADVMPGPVSTQTIPDLTGFKVYPNPVGDKMVWVEMAFSTAKDLNVQLLNAFGQAVHKSEYSNVTDLKTEINTSNLPSGVYFLKVVSLNENGLMVYKLIKQ